MTSILGTLGTADGKGVVRMETRVETRVDDVWAAVTNRGRLAEWLGEVEGDLRLGGELRAHYFASGWEGRGRIEACDPPQRLLVLIRDVDDPEAAYDRGNALEVTLTADGGATVIVWEERGMPLDLLSAYGAGIQVQFEDLLSYVGGGERCDAGARFGELHPAYQDLAAGVS